MSTRQGCRLARFSTQPCGLRNSTFFSVKRSLRRSSRCVVPALTVHNTQPLPALVLRIQSASVSDFLWCLQARGLADADADTKQLMHDLCEAAVVELYDLESEVDEIRGRRSQLFPASAERIKGSVPHLPP